MIPQPAPAPHAFAPGLIAGEQYETPAALWRAHTVALSVGGVASCDFEATAVAISAEAAGADALFFAAADGEDARIAAAFGRGAAAVVCERPIAGPHVLVADAGAALLALARAGRNRARATVVAMVGFDHAIGAADALFTALDRQANGMAERGADVADVAGMAQENRFALFETTGLATLAALRSHIVLLGSGGDAPQAEELLAMVEPGGTLVLSAGKDGYAALRSPAEARGVQLVGYGRERSADVRLLDCVQGPEGAALVTADMGERRICYALAADNARLRARIEDSLAVMAATRAAGGSLGAAAIALAGLTPAAAMVDGARARGAG